MPTIYDHLRRHLEPLGRAQTLTRVSAGSAVTSPMSTPGFAATRTPAAVIAHTDSEGAGYIATDPDQNIIYGIGTDPDAAWSDAQTGEPTGDYVVIPATLRLLDRVQDIGGADVAWTVTDGVADLDD